MAWTGIEWQYAATAALCLVFAALLLVRGFSDRINRTFGYYMAFQGLMWASVIAPASAGPLQGLRALGVYVSLASPFLLLYAAAAYHDRYARPGLRRWAFPILVVLGSAAPLAFLIDHGVYGTSRNDGWGLFWTWLPMFSGPFLGAVLARDAAGAQSPVRRRGLILASLGLSFFPTAWLLHLWIPDLMEVTRGTSYLDAMVLLTAAAPIAYMVATFWRLARRGPDPGTRHEARLFLVLLGLAPVTVLAILVVRLTQSFEVARDTMRHIMLAWIAIGAGITTYAVLWNQAFGTERTVKRAIRAGTVVSAFVAVFFVGSQVLQSFLQEVVSWLWAGLAAALLVFALKPLSAIGARLANAALPEVEETPAYRHYRSLQVYEAALLAAWEDGRIREEERNRLDRLSGKLDLPAADVRALEKDFERQMRRIRGSPATLPADGSA